MKKIRAFIIGIIALAICLPTAAFAETQEVKIADDFIIEVDDSWIVIKPDDLSSDAKAKGYEIDEDFYKSLFDETEFNTFLLSIEARESEEPILVGIGITDSTSEINSLLAMRKDGKLTQEFLNGVYDGNDLLDGYQIVPPVEFFDIEDYVFVTYSCAPDDAETQRHLSVYTTIENNKNYFFDVLSDSPLNEEEQKRIEEIVKTTKIELDPAYAENEYYDSDDADGIADEDNSSSATVIAVRILWGAIIFAIIIIIVDRRNRRKAKEKALANKINEDIREMSSIDSVTFAVKRSARKPLKVSGKIGKGKRLNG